MLQFACNVLLSHAQGLHALYNPLREGKLLANPRRASAGKPQNFELNEQYSSYTCKHVY